MTTIIVPIDGIDAEVDQDKYLADPEGAVASIQEDRRNVADLTELYDVPDWDYDSLDTVEVIAVHQSTEA